MKKSSILITLILTVLLLNGCGSGHSKESANLNDKEKEVAKVVIGYIPTWKDMRKTIDATDLNILTHINLSFLNPDASGAFLLNGEPICSDGASADIKYVVKKAHENGVKVLVSLGGGTIPQCSGDWKTLLQSSHRTTVVNNLKALADFYNLDGIDVDIEGGLLNDISEAGDYTPFIQELRAVLHPLGKLVTCATASYVGGMIPKSAIPYFDYVNIMAYDNHWKRAENHATFEDAVRDMELWLDLGCPADKLVLGVPFYGYMGTVGSGGVAYKTIVEQDPNAAQVDAYKEYKYNGIPTMRAKTEYAIKHGAGIMIWEISNDASDSLSLLQAIGKKLK
ncbi:glycosyl hydrolase family 18 protein [Gelidibacter sp.]|uniref:glycosyl hydrolase family 18 protein n=1 Tax=Gelidibacter sp. TaxID=2018083 RepID=UPI002CD3AAB1|nr:glycosyl hydrolase family 18 protein [Gelidibacter sp.]HUH27069.1 glycosyl hydrolase family 18 protein [Gelidibacter sp.]